jgi:hypothetical protein
MFDSEQEKQPFQYVSGVALSEGRWRALHGSVCASFSVKKYGPSARTLAEDAYERMVSGLPPFEDEMDETIGRYNFALSIAAAQLGMTVRMLRQWMVSGEIHENRIRPPAKASGKDYVSGYELMAAQRRLQDAGLLEQERRGLCIK